MARVKDLGSAAEITIKSKIGRMERLKRLFGIRNLSELFPENSTPNSCGADFLKCSGDVLRDLCQVGEVLRDVRLTPPAAKSRVKREFVAGKMATHLDVRNLLKKLRVNKKELEDAIIAAHRNNPGFTPLKNNGEDDGDEAGEDVNVSSYFGDFSDEGNGDGDDVEITEMSEDEMPRGSRVASANNNAAEITSPVTSPVIATPSLKVARRTSHPATSRTIMSINKTAINQSANEKHLDRLLSALKASRNLFNDMREKLEDGETLTTAEVTVGAAMIDQALLSYRSRGKEN